MSLIHSRGNSGLSADPAEASNFHGVLIDGYESSYGKAPVGIRRDRAYEADIIALLNRIYSSQAGRAVFREVETLLWGRSLTIRPAERAGENQVVGWEPNGNAGLVDPVEFCVHPRKKRPNEHFILPKCVSMGYEKFLPVRDDDEVEVRFTPGMYSALVRAHKGVRAREAAGAHPDAALLHELIHGVRYARGIVDAVPLRFGYDDEEEWIAIMWVNIYSSEGHRLLRVSSKLAVPDLRCNHHGHLACPWTDETFLPESADNPEALANHAMMRKFVLQHPVTANSLRHIPCSFNPVRRYFQLTEHWPTGKATS